MFGHTQIPIHRFPQFFPAITSIITIEIVFLVMMNLYGKGSNPLVWIQYGAMEPSHVEIGEWWRFFSAVYLHTDLLEFLFDVFALYIFAPQLEWLLGRVYFLLLYTLTGGSFYFFIYQSGTEGIFHGALGSVYGILGVYLYLGMRKAIHPQQAKNLSLISIIYLIVFYETWEANLFAFFTGILLAMIFIQLRQLKFRKQKSNFP